MKNKEDSTSISDSGNLKYVYNMQQAYIIHSIIIRCKFWLHTMSKLIRFILLSEMNWIFKQFLLSCVGIDSQKVLHVRISVHSIIYHHRIVSFCYITEVGCYPTLCHLSLPPLVVVLRKSPIWCQIVINELKSD